MPSYKAGRAEAIRLTFVLAGIPFEDNRLPGAEVMAAISSGRFPTDMVPVLEIDGVQYSESIAIMRYVARVGGMYPTEAEAALAADMAADYAADLRSRLVRIRFGPEEKKASSLEELMKKFPTRVDKLFARKSPRSKFFGGGSPGFPDPAVYSLALEAELHDVLTDLPALAQFKADFEAIPAVAEYQKAAAERWPPAPPAKAAASTSKPITQQPWFLPSIAVAAIGAGALIFAKSR